MTEPNASPEPIDAITETTEDTQASLADSIVETPEEAPNVTYEAPPAPPAPSAQPIAAAPVVYGAGKPTVAPDGRPISQKSRLIAVLLCFFLGALGIHSFYAGKNTNGIIQIVITFVTLGTLGWVWPLIDFIMLLMGSYTDSDDKVILNWET